jgi:hypothetical protein
LVGRATGVLQRQSTPLQNDKQPLVVLNAVKHPLDQTLEVFPAGSKTLIPALQGSYVGADESIGRPPPQDDRPGC